MLKTISRFLANEDGPTAVEYAIMLALIIVVCISAVAAVGTQTSALFLDSSNKIDEIMP